MAKTDFLGDDALDSATSQKHPFMKFFPANWRSDAALRSCSLAARGLWMEMISLMHEAEPRGFLVLNGRPLTPRQLAFQAGAPLKDVEALLQELDEAGVFSRDEQGTIFSRRLVRETARSKIAKQNGSGGGNPNLVGKDKQNQRKEDNRSRSKSVNRSPHSSDNQLVGDLDNQNSNLYSARAIATHIPESREDTYPVSDTGLSGLAEDEDPFPTGLDRPPLGPIALAAIASNRGGRR